MGALLRDPSTTSLVMQRQWLIMLVDLIFIVPSADEFVCDLPKLIEALDEPLAGPGLFPQYAVSKLAREHVTVVLGGQGGDEILAVMRVTLWVI